MKRSEQVNLTNQIETIQAFSKKHSDLSSFYKEIDNVPLVSIQDLSFEKDIALFKELSFILSVVLSIIAKPHLNTRSDEVIARSGEVSALSEDDFQKTLRDSSIWKNQGNGKLLPEYLYYHKHEDEIRIYENIFIVYLVNEINALAHQYSALYVSLLSVADHETNVLLIDDTYQMKAMDEVNKVIHRIEQIKNTYFYKEVSKAKSRPKVFSPTNILLKDRLYNICFKFYKKLFIYQEEGSLDQDLFIYYYVLILRKLRENDFRLEEGQEKIFSNGKLVIPEKISMANNNYQIEVESRIDKNLFIFNYSEHDGSNKATHLLYIRSDDHAPFEMEDIGEDYFVVSIETLSLWYLSMLLNDKLVKVNKTFKSEMEMIRTFVDSHHYVVSASEKIYSSYCPSCKGKDLSETNGFYVCADCGAVYRFVKDKQNKGHIVFSNLINYGRK